MNALILGGAACVWEDLEALEEVVGGPWTGLVVAANDIGCVYPGHLDHWVSLHPQHFPEWTALRAKNGHSDGYTTWTSDRAKAGHVAEERLKRPYHYRGGSSGMLGVLVAWKVGADRCVLAGVPMTRTPHFEESVAHLPDVPWKRVDKFWRTWTKNSQELQRSVRSMSGRTRTLLGAPDAEWLKAGPIPA